MSINRKRLALYSVSFIFMALVIAGVYLWQHKNVNSLNKKVATINSQLKAQKDSNSGLEQQNSSIAKQLNEANQTIDNLKSTGNFVSGAPCQSQQLSLELANNVGAAAGNRYYLLNYQNISQSECTVRGYPGFLALDSSGHVVPDGPIQTDSSPSPTAVTLNPQDKAYFLLHWGAEGVTQDQKCINTSLIESTPPINTYPLIATASFNVCGPIIDVSALEPLSQFSSYIR